MTKEDEEFLARVAKEAPEALKADIPERAFDVLGKRLIDAPPHPKQKRQKLGTQNRKARKRKAR
jgi:hypothetical protein